MQPRTEVSVAGVGGPRRSPAPLRSCGMEGQHPSLLVSPCPQKPCCSDPRSFILAAQRGVKQFSQGHADLPKDMQKACGKAGNLRWVPASPAHSLFAAFKQIKIPSEGWTSALLGGQRAENPSLCQGHRLKEPF